MKLQITAAIILGVAMSAVCQGKPKPMKVYILAGQSNMTGMVSPRTLEHVKMFPDTAKEFAELFDKNGNPVVLDDVYVTQWKEKEGGKLTPKYGGGKGGGFGPEFAFGVFMHKKLQEPFLIIKTSQGGKDINYHFRPPSAGTWTPPKGHPDLIKKADLPPPPKLPIPKKIDLPDDWTPEKPYALRKRHMGLKSFKGAPIGKVSGASPIYIMSPPRDKIKGDPFMKGDLILAVDGSGLRDDPISHWRDAFHSSKKIDGDWKIEITRWRKGKIETFEFDICDTFGGRAKLPEHIAAMKAAAVEKEKLRGGYYRDMIKYVKTVLADPKKHHPAYDPKAGYEIAGLVWFQGWNDMINGGVYPNRDKPRGYEQYTWLMEHFIRDARKDLNAPEMKVVIGTIGVGGYEDPPSTNMGYLQQAQAAPANNPEFKGTVAAVHTGKYWDHDLDALIKKSSKVRSKMNDFKYNDGLEGDALKKAYAEYRAKHMTPAEEKLLKAAVSNQGFHYHGSAKIMVGIGKGFADVMIELEKKGE